MGGTIISEFVHCSFLGQLLVYRGFRILLKYSIKAVYTKKRQDFSLLKHCVVCIS